MEANFLIVYGAEGGGDEMGRFQSIQSYHSTFEPARKATKGAGTWGNDGRVIEVPAVQVGRYVYVLQHKEPIDLDGVKTAAEKALRKVALAKLSPAERRVLGIEESA